MLQTVQTSLNHSTDYTRQRYVERYELRDNDRNIID